MVKQLLVRQTILGSNPRECADSGALGKEESLISSPSTFDSCHRYTTYSEIALSLTEYGCGQGTFL